ncbi:DUF2510 domain-containing protein [Agromyces humi]|uniref:DUF2510 domain-containing protein n=1 Tax=Agromyces humi TaxID=1766800 RepID=UPI001F2BA907|nr:DUF2510 domain-containing protein [Agromyces humi]
MTSTTPPAGWYPDPSAPGQTRWWDGTAWAPAQSAQLVPAAAGNPIANRARIIGWWAIGVGATFWFIPIALTLIPVAEVQTFAILTSWVGFLPVLTLTVLAIVFGSIGLRRAQAQDGLGRRAARFGLWAGIGTLASPVVVVLIVLIAVVITAAISG